MLRLMSGKTRRDRIMNGTIRESVGVAPIVEKTMRNSFRWFGHIDNIHVYYVARKVDQMKDG